MKNLLVLILAVSSMLVSCRPLGGEAIQGTLTVNPKWGSSLELYDVNEEKEVSLPTGRYTLQFPVKWLPFTDPKIEILDAKQNVVVTIKVNSKKIHRDGTFELFLPDSRQASGVNVLGGQRNIVLSRERYSAIREYCTYTVTVPCESTCTDAQGKTYSCESTCTETRSGDQDVAYEKRQVKSLYRILFDGSDLVNAAVFSGEGKIRNETVTLDSTTCD